MFVIAFALLSSRILPGVLHLRAARFLVYNNLSQFFSDFYLYLQYVAKMYVVKGDCEKTGIKNNCDLRTIPI
jgi:hypothetical protein